MLQVPHLHIRQTDTKGRGIFAGLELHIGDVIELCPVVVIPKKEVKSIDQTILYEYYFLWGTQGDVCLALGYGSIYNHDDSPNAEAINLLDEAFIRIVCIRNIKSGEEITISYSDSKVSNSLWFKTTTD